MGLLTAYLSLQPALLTSSAHLQVWVDGGLALCPLSDLALVQASQM